VDRQREALQLAEELLADIELSRLQPSQVLLKASRLARLLSDDSAREWLDFELNGYPASGRADSWLKRMGRFDSQDGQRTPVRVPLAALAAFVTTQEMKLTTLQGLSLSGDALIPTVRSHHELVNLTAQAISTYAAMTSAVLSQIYEFASRSYYELLFSDAQATLFESIQSEIDSRLAPISGRALEKIESVADRLRAGDPEAISGVCAFERCKQGPARPVEKDNGRHLRTRIRGRPRRRNR
jgi:hypothetical protein